MMEKTIVENVWKLIKLLGRLGYAIERQRGSHIRLRKQLKIGHHSITVPSHKEIAKGTLNDKVSIYTQISKEELITKIKEI